MGNEIPPGKALRKRPRTIWKPGEHGGGRGPPKGLVAMIREKTNNGFAIVEFMWEVMSDTKAARKDRIEAAKWLADRGHGKAPELIIAGAMSDDLLSTAASLTADQLLALTDSTPSVIDALPSSPLAGELAAGDEEATDTTEPTE